MLTRRHLLHRGIALAVAAGSGGAIVAAGARSDRETLRVTRFLVDARSNGAPAIRRVAERAGAEVLDAGSDLGPLLYGPLLRDWREGATDSLAGLTGAASLLFVERLAFDFGLRAVYVVRHAGEGTVAHRVRGPAPMSDAFAARLRLGDWRSAAVAASLAVPASARPLRLSQEHLAPDMVRDGALFSWTLVPAGVLASTTTRERRA